MKFVFNRDRVVASTSGHVLGFKKNVPQYVPPEARKDVYAAGGTPEDEEYVPESEVKKPAAPEEPVDPAERQVAVFAVFKKLVERNKREDFTAHNVPHSKVLKTELGWELSGQERDLLWEQFQKDGPAS